MYMKVFPHGQGSGHAPTHYLVRQDYHGRDESPPQVSRGNVETTRLLIDSLETKWRFTAGVLSWHPDDKVTEEQEEKIMDDFESVAFAGLETDQRNILWVRHSHAGHHELHFVIPRMELHSGRHSIHAHPAGKNILMCFVICTICVNNGQDLTTRHEQGFLLQSKQI